MTDGRREKDNKGITVKKNSDFSEWYSEIVQKAELGDLRYNIKGFLESSRRKIVFQINLCKICNFINLLDVF